MFLLISFCTFVYFCKIGFHGSRIANLKGVCVYVYYILNIYVIGYAFLVLFEGMTKLCSLREKFELI